MDEQKAGKIPDFAENEEDNQKAEGKEEVKQTEDEESSDGEKATPLPDSSGEKKPADLQKVGDDIDKDKDAALLGLAAEREKLLTEIQQLRGTRRDLRQQTSEVTNEAQDKKDIQESSLDDEINPEDYRLIKNVLEKEGYVKKDEALALNYKNVEQQQLESWLEEHPEFKVENDPHDRNWNTLMAEYNLYIKPKDPNKTKEFLNRALKAFPKKDFVNGQGAEGTQNQRKMETAGMGSEGTTPPSSSGLSVPSGLNEQEAREHLSRGGWSEEEINEILKK
ncbi:MAG: hypothetical protein WC441_05415 [Patescibacteria group bacterium]